MRVVEYRRAESRSGSTPTVDCADQTRRVLTHDLLLRASHACPGEARALEFRALHLNLPLIREVAEGLALTDHQRAAVEHDALDGLHEAVRRFDPYGDVDFTELAAACVEDQIRRHVPAEAP
ncbi:hypothetical protein [Nocardioides sp.]|jgi:hypothetical protein|uniref:hypothetical protein n=1 Tax=Nocardioides sp. TaxID=35761 RepID=UPI002F41601F